MKPNSNVIKLFLKEKGFYLVLAVCIIGASAAAWLTANKTLNSIEENNRKVVEQNISGESKPWQDSDPAIIPEPPTKSVENKQKDTKKPQPSPSSQSEASSLPQGLSDSSANSEPSAPEQRLEQSPYTLPMASLAVIQPYSNGELVKNKTLGVWRTHDGVDLKGDKGCDITAASDGVVAAVGTDPLWGGYVELTHPDGCTSYYNGITAEKSLKKGDNVKGGQKLGTLGEIPAEIAMEPHLHFAIKKKNSYVDPALYLKLK